MPPMQRNVRAGFRPDLPLPVSFTPISSLYKILYLFKQYAFFTCETTVYFLDPKKN